MHFSKEELRENYARLTDVKVVKTTTPEADTPVCNPTATPPTPLQENTTIENRTPDSTPANTKKNNRLQKFMANFLSHFRQ